ncbi:MAG: DNA polymerase III subunit beta [Rhodothermia bacterium]
MRFTASSAQFLQALNVVSGAVPTKSTLAILECVLFEQDGDALRLSATDLEISILQDVKVTFESGDDAGKDRIAVPARRLLETLRALPDLPIQFSSNDEYHIELTTDQGRYKMVGFDGADYPAIPTFEGGKVIKIGGAMLKRTIQKTGFAASKDALRPAMMGIYFEVTGETGKAVATDGHRLVRLVNSALTAEEPVSFIVPVKAVGLAGRVAPDADCSITVGEGYVGFSLGETNVLARMIDESYPNYQAVIPVENDRRLTVNRDSMLAAVKRVALYSSSMTHQIRLSLSAGKIEISAEDIERASEAKEAVLCEYDSEDLEIGFNSVYLTDILSNIDSQDAIFEFSTPNRAGVVTPAEQPDNEDMLMLIMPVMLNTYA